MENLGLKFKLDQKVIEFSKMTISIDEIELRGQLDDLVVV